MSSLENTTKRITEVDNMLVESLYLETEHKPIITRKNMLENWYPELTLKELQQLQNDK